MGLIQRRGHRRGMTAMELMLVTGILATLAGQSGSAFLQAKNKALGNQCQYHLQEIYLAVQIAADDNDGALPKARFFPLTADPDDPNQPYKLNPSDPFSIVNVVAKTNTGIRKLFVCPGAPEPWQKIGLTYVYNDTLGGRLLDTIQDPSNTWMMMDANVVNLQKFPAPHLGGYNVLFCDGRVKWIPAQQIGMIWRAGLQNMQQ